MAPSPGGVVAVPELRIGAFGVGVVPEGVNPRWYTGGVAIRDDAVHQLRRAIVPVVTTAGYVPRPDQDRARGFKSAPVPAWPPGWPTPVGPLPGPPLPT